MTSIPCLSGILRTLFERDAPALAHQMGLRQRVFNGMSLALLLVFGWLQHPQAGPSALARFADNTQIGGEQFGSLVSATLLGNADVGERRQAAALGLELTPVSLQQLIIHLTSTASHRKALEVVCMLSALW